MKSKMHHNRLHSTPYFHYYSWNQAKYLYILKTFKNPLIAHDTYVQIVSRVENYTFQAG